MWISVSRFYYYRGQNGAWACGQSGGGTNVQDGSLSCHGGCQSRVVRYGLQIGGMSADGLKKWVEG